MAFSSPRSTKRRTDAFETFSKNAASLILTARRFVLVPLFVDCCVRLGFDEAVMGSGSALMFICLFLVAGLRPSFCGFGPDKNPSQKILVVFRAGLTRVAFCYAHRAVV